MTDEQTTEFEMPKSFDNIEEARCAEDGVYALMLSQPAYRKENNAKTGYNVILDLMITEDTEEANGIICSFYLPLPNSTDEGKKTRNGQPMVDWKMERIKETVELLGGTIEGNRFSIPEYAMCKAKVIKRVSEESGKPFNQIEGNLLSYDS